MSRGMILGHMGKAVAGVGDTVSSMMVRQSEEEQRRADRERERDEQRAFQAEQNALYRKPADAQGSGRASSGGSGSGISLDGLGGTPRGMVAGKLGMTDPELAAYDEAQQTGDFSKFKTGKRPGEYGDAGPEQVDPATFEAARADYPPGVSEDSIRAKLKMIAEVRTGMAMGKDNESYQDGERSRQTKEGIDEAMKNPERAGIIGKAFAAGKGDGAYGKGNVDQFTGTPDQIGQSVIRENNAQAGKASADASASKDGTKNETLKALTQERIAVTSAAAEAQRELAALRGMAKNIPLSEREAHKAEVAGAKAKLERYEQQRDDLNGRIRAFTSLGSAPAAKTSAAPAGGVTKGGSKYQIVK